MDSVTFKDLPSVLSFSRCHIVSDARMYSRLPDGTEQPIPVVRHGFLGTQNFSEVKNGKVPLPGVTETARLGTGAVALVVRFGLSMLDIGASLHSCSGPNSKEVREELARFVSRARQSDGLMEVARRYARNIANGRWLWRNRSLAKSIAITATVKSPNGTDANFRFSSLDIPMGNFDGYLESERALAREIAAQLCGDSLNSIEVEAVVTPRVAGNTEVFPSQVYVNPETKPEGLGRLIYKINASSPRSRKSMDPVDFMDAEVLGEAALRDQKVWNALRTIDTWYPSFGETGLPISIEPNGANLSLQEFFRKNKEGFSMFDLLKRIAGIDPNSPDGMFCIAMLDRGGVMSEKDKERQKKSNKGKEQSGDEDQPELVEEEG